MTRTIAMLALAAIGTAGCKPPPCETDKPIPVQLLASSDATVNLGDDGEPWPVFYYVFELSEEPPPAALKNPALLADDQGLLGKSLLQTHEHNSYPGKSEAWTLTLDSEAEFILVVALYRRVVGDSWYSLTAVPEGYHQRVCEAEHDKEPPPRPPAFTSYSRATSSAVGASLRRVSIHLHSIPRVHRPSLKSQMRPAVAVVASASVQTELPLEQSMKISRAGRPIWTEGMLVCPQHMQHQDLYHEQSLDTRIRAVSQSPWGVSSLAFDPARLQSGTISLTSFAGILPDGTVAEFNSQTMSQLPARSIGSGLSPARDPLAVFLGIKLLQESTGNVAKSEDPVERRYSSTNRPVHDLVTARDRTISVCQPNFALLLETDRQDDYSTLKIAEIVRSENGHISLSSSYIPPLLQIRGSSNLTSALRDIVTAVITRRRSLAEETNSKGTVRGVRPSDLEKALFIQALDISIPLLRSCLRDEGTPPIIAYRAMCQLCAALCYPSGDGDSTAFPPYSSVDLRGTFQPLVELAHRQLKRQFAQTHIEFDLVRTATHWLAKDPRLELCRDLFFAVRASGDRATIRSEVLAGTKAAALSRLRLILPTAAPGITLEPLATPPVGVPSVENELFFRLLPKSPLYQEAMLEGDLAICIRKPYDPSNARLRLIGLPRDGAVL